MAAPISTAVRTAGFTDDFGTAGQGVPDKLVVTPGFAAFFEIKTPTGKLRKGQRLRGALAP